MIHSLLLALVGAVIGGLLLDDEGASAVAREVTR